MLDFDKRVASERRDERRFEGDLPAAVAVGPAGGVRAMAGRITSLSASGLVLEAALEAQVGQEIWVKIPGFDVVKCTVWELRGGSLVCRIALDPDGRKRLAVWVAWLERHGQPLALNKEGHS